MYICIYMNTHTNICETEQSYAWDLHLFINIKEQRILVTNLIRYEKLLKLKHGE